MMKTQIIILVLATLTSGLMAGIFFTWSNAVTPGIGKLCDMDYLRALQSMNRVILNPAFRLVFIGAIITVALAPIFYFRTQSNQVFWLLFMAFGIYWIGAFGVTFFGNIPLNRMLESTNLETISIENARILRDDIEVKWNNMNLMRSISSGVTFLLLIVSFLFLDK